MTTTTFQHILVPTDFGDPAKHAREIAIAIARRFDSKITLFHAYYLPPLAYGEGFAIPMDEFHRAAQKALDKELDETRLTYPKVEAILRPTSPADGVVSLARELSADLIVMGTEGRRGTSRFLLGSVAENVVRLAAVPVLTVSAKVPS